MSELGSGARWFRDGGMTGKAQIKGGFTRGQAVRKGWEEICKRGQQKRQNEVAPGLVYVTG